MPTTPLTSHDVLPLIFRGYTYTTFAGFYKAIHSGRWDDIIPLTYDSLTYRLKIGMTPEEAVTDITRTSPVLHCKSIADKEQGWETKQSYLTCRWDKPIPEEYYNEKRN